MAVNIQIIVFWLWQAPALTLVSCSAYFSTLKMEAIFSSETSVDSQRTTRRYIPEDGTLHVREYCVAQIMCISFEYAQQNT
jgi:hypothetical protein